MSSLLLFARGLTLARSLILVVLARVLLSLTSRRALAFGLLAALPLALTVGAGATMVALALRATFLRLGS